VPAVKADGRSFDPSYRDQANVFLKVFKIFSSDTLTNTLFFSHIYIEGYIRNILKVLPQIFEN